MKENLNQEVARILDWCVADLQEKTKSIEECLASYPDHRKELEPLLELTVRLQAASSISASPGFRQAALVRMRNLTEHRRSREPGKIATTGYLRLYPTGRKWQGLSVASMLIVLLLVFGLGIMTASASALPGDWLYPVKIRLESLRLATTPQGVEKAFLHLNLATRRMEEAIRLVNRNNPQSAQIALKAYQQQIEAGFAYLGAEGRIQQEEQARVGEQFANQMLQHEQLLAGMLSQTAETNRFVIQNAVLQTTRNRERLRALMQGLPGNQPPGPLPGLSDAPPVSGGDPSATPIPPASPTNRFSSSRTPMPGGPSATKTGWSQTPPNATPYGAHGTATPGWRTPIGGFNPPHWLTLPAWWPTAWLTEPPSLTREPNWPREPTSAPPSTREPRSTPRATREPAVTPEPKPSRAPSTPHGSG
jgi:hypothetical protein